mmetsp:Transcript_24320/g.27029  ORF Transcript_24320/g.27029 Transcript_24320/m.27029 type:complete len:336 (-) Transcript_24320:101-1108(-)
MAKTFIVWVIDGEERDGGYLCKEHSEVTFADVKRLYNGPVCNFLFKTPDYSPEGKQLPTYHWTLIDYELSPVPLTKPNGQDTIYICPQILESPVTNVRYHVDGINTPIVLTIKKPTRLVLVNDVKSRLPGFGGVFLFKTPEQALSPTDQDPHHWAMLLNHSGVRPSGQHINEIECRIKTNMKPMTIVSIQVWGSNATPGYVRINRPPSEICLADVLPYFRSIHGVYLLKVYEEGGYHYFLIRRNNEAFPVADASQVIEVIVVPPKSFESAAASLPISHLSSATPMASLVTPLNNNTINNMAPPSMASLASLPMASIAPLAPMATIAPVTSMMDTT